ncbi:MAG TPA: hypothetical protein VEV84_13995 [Pyrinomonadaceae bacterium]|nr:hypothetical protein [Pyrinomonadaceae bacterium]
MPRLKFVLPDKEDESLLIDQIPFVLSGVDTSLTVLEIAGVSAQAFEYRTLGMSAFGIGIAGAVVGQWFALGSGYAEAWEKVRSDREPMGFAYGVVAAADGRSARYTALHLGEKDAEGDYLDKTSGRVAQKAFNKGLRNGWIQGNDLTQNQKRFLWRDLVSRSDYNGKISGEQTKSWGDAQWKIWYREMAIIFRKFHIGR